MITCRRISCIALFLLILSSLSSAKAAIVYSLEVRFSNNSNSITVVEGQAFSAGIYLYAKGEKSLFSENGSPGGGTDPTKGVGIANFYLFRQSVDSNVSITGAAGEAVFDSPGSSFSNANQAYIEQGRLGPGYAQGDYYLEDTINNIHETRILLGTVQLLASTVGISTFGLGDPGLTQPGGTNLNEDITLFDDNDPAFFFPLDDLIAGSNGFGSGTITVQSAPEPTTMGALGAFGAIGAAVSYYRRRKQKQASPTTAA